LAAVLFVAIAWLILVVGETGQSSLAINAKRSL